MTKAGFSQLPHAGACHTTPFTVDIPEHELDNLKALLRSSPIGPSTYENSGHIKEFGITQAWLSEAKKAWINEFDWRRVEGRINSLPNFRANVNGMSIHFLALFSRKPQAAPLLLLHGWPGSFLELLPVLELLSHKYTPDTLPYHVVIPSLPGYGFSAGPPLDTNFGLRDAAQLMDELMIGLGFDEYTAHGGDVGSMLTMLLSSTSAACMAIHVTYLAPSPDEIPKEGALEAREREHLAKSQEWRKSGMGYALEQSTRPATIGLALSASPLALLAWVGEKFLEWAGEPISMDDILGIVSLYWLTSSYPRTIWSYRSVMGDFSQGFPTSKTIPLGYSLFAHELAILPRSWASSIYPNLVAYFQHDKGGHFPGLERPADLLGDIETFMQKVHEGGQVS